jgi:hypothetical protein
VPAFKSGETLADLDLGPDGTLVVVKPPQKEHQIGARVAWASPAAPRLHVLPLARSTYFVKLVGGKIAFERGTEDRGDVPRAEVGVTDLEGHVRIVARGAYAASQDRRFDFDGKRIAWFAYSCHGARMHVQAVKDTHRITESLTRCPLRLTRKPHVSKDGVVSVRPSCYGYSGGHFNYPSACWATGIVLMARENGHRVIVAQGSVANHLPLTDAGMTLLKKRGALTVRVAATMRDPAGTHERRHGQAVLSARRRGAAGRGRGR